MHACIRNCYSILGSVYFFYLPPPVFLYHNFSSTPPCPKWKCFSNSWSRSWMGVELSLLGRRVFHQIRQISRWLGWEIWASLLRLLNQAEKMDGWTLEQLLKPSIMLCWHHQMLKQYRSFFLLTTIFVTHIKHQYHGIYRCFNSGTSLIWCLWHGVTDKSTPPHDY